MQSKFYQIDKIHDSISKSYKTILVLYEGRFYQKHAIEQVNPRDPRKFKSVSDLYLDIWVEFAFGEVYTCVLYITQMYITRSTDYADS